MKISKINNSLLLSSTVQNKLTANKQAEQTTNNFEFSANMANSIKAYNMAGISFGKALERPALSGIENAVVKPSYDTYELIYKVKSPYTDTDKVGISYRIPGDKEDRFAFSSSKGVGNEFTIKVPVLNRKDNTIVKKINILGAGYFNSDNQLEGDEKFKKEPIVVTVADIFNSKSKKTTTLNGKSLEMPFDNISEGVSEGKLVQIDYDDLIRYQGNEPIIGLLEDKDMNSLLMEMPSGNFSLPDNVKGVIAAISLYQQDGFLSDVLGHAVTRLRGRKTFAIAPASLGEELKAKVLADGENSLIKMKLTQNKMNIEQIDKLTPVDTSRVKVPEYTLVNNVLSVDDAEFTPEAVGLKAFNLGKLQKMQEEGGFRVPEFVVIPAGMLDAVKRAPQNENTYGEPDMSSIENLGPYHYNRIKADKSTNPSPELKTLRNLIVEDMYFPKEMREEIRQAVEEKVGKLTVPDDIGCMIARSSFNGEDSDVYATQGLYDSFPGIRTYEDLFKGIKEVWASKWSNLAYWSRRDHGIDHGDIQPNVIVQNVVPVDYTFTINTADPRSNDPNKIVIQLSQGVYSGFPNSPYVFEYDKTTGVIKRTALATKKRMKGIEDVVMDDPTNLKYQLADYSKDPLNKGKREYSPIIKKVMDVAKFIEANMDGKPQDIEGGIKFVENQQTGKMEPEIHIWQTRDVHLIKR